MRYTDVTRDGVRVHVYVPHRSKKPQSRSIYPGYERQSRLRWLPAVTIILLCSTITLGVLGYENRYIITIAVPILSVTVLMSFFWAMVTPSSWRYFVPFKPLFPRSRRIAAARVQNLRSFHRAVVATVKWHAPPSHKEFAYFATEDEIVEGTEEELEHRAQELGYHDYEGQSIVPLQVQETRLPWYSFIDKKQRAPKALQGNGHAPDCSCSTTDVLLGLACRDHSTI